MRSIDQLPTAAPEAHGVPSAAIVSFIDAVEQRALELHSLMLLRHGHVLAQGSWAPYRFDDPHMMFSLSKSFTSTAVGLAVAEGLLTVDDEVLQYFPEDAPAEPSDNLRAMRVRHLLSMSTGHAEDTIGILFRSQSTNWARSFFEVPVEYAPGTHFLYNSGATYMLSAIVQRLTGQRLLHYLQPRLFEPLGIEGASWEQSPQGVDTGGWGLKIRTADVAAFGQLYLQQGSWQGRQLVPQSWVAEATRSHISNGDDPDNDWHQGYGYQFWRCRHDAYRGDGAFGQFCVVLPEQEAVLATTAGLGDMQAVLSCVWEHLLPAMGDAPLADDPTASARLEQRLAGLELPVLRSAARSPLAVELNGRTFAFDVAEALPSALSLASAQTTEQATALRYEFGDDRSTLTSVDANGTHAIAAGDGAWITGATGYGDGVTRPIAATSGWLDDRTFELRLRYLGSPYGLTINSRFDGDTVTVQHTQNVSFGPTEGTPREGRLQD